MQDGPDGKPWIVIQVDNPLCSIVTTVPVSQAEQLVSEFPKMLSSAIMDAKRAASPLTVATTETLQDYRRKG